MSTKRYEVCLRVEYAYTTNEVPARGDTWSVSVDAENVYEAIKKVKAASLVMGAREPKGGTA